MTPASPTSATSPVSPASTVSTPSASVGSERPMTELVIVATPATAVGFRLGGARTVVAVSADDVLAAVRAASADGAAAVIAVHGSLWSLVPPLVREAWTRQAAPLVLSLPDEDGDVAAARDAALRELLARAIGYRITFTPAGGTP